MASDEAQSFVHRGEYTSSPTVAVNCGEPGTPSADKQSTAGQALLSFVCPLLGISATLLSLLPPGGAVSPLISLHY